MARAVAALDARVSGGHVDRIVQRDGATLELVLTGPPAGPEGRARVFVVLSCDAAHGRVGEALRFAPAPPSPLAFAQRLRACVGRARVREVFGRPGERELGLRLDAREGAHGLVLQLLGARSNVYLLDASGAILASLRPLADSRPELAVGAPLLPPRSVAPSEGEDRFEAVPDAELLREIERRYGAREREAGAEALARRIATTLARERQRLLRREAALQADLEKGRPSAALRREGELLKGALHEIVPGASEVRLHDPAGEGTITVALDPSLSPAANLERLFAGYQRARRREAAAAEQRARLAADLDAVRALEAALDGLSAGGDTPDAAALAALAARPVLAKLLGRSRARGARQAPPAAPARPKRKSGGTPARLRPGRYRTSDGLEVWVGRSAEGNDHLTTRMARGNDLFFHVEASPGSHVVLRTAGRKEAPQESLLEAAELAVHFSKQRHATRATVHLAAIRDVRKPRGAKPGLVHVQRGRSLSLRRDASRLARILDARIEDED